MTLRNLLSRLSKGYNSFYIMSPECKIESTNKNTTHLSQILPAVLLFGITMTIITILSIGPSDPRFGIFILYYLSYVVLGSISLGMVNFLRKKKGTLAAQNILCYFFITAAQLLCIYQKITSSFPEGYIVWTIANLVIIALFNVQPIFLLISMTIQFAIINVYEYLYGVPQILNLSLLFFITILLFFMRWRQIIKDFKPDVIHTENNALIPAYLALRKIKKNQRPKVFHTMHLKAEDETSNKIVRFLYKFIGSFIF